MKSLITRFDAEKFNQSQYEIHAAAASSMCTRTNNTINSFRRNVHFYSELKSLQCSPAGPHLDHNGGGHVQRKGCLHVGLDEVGGGHYVLPIDLVQELVVKLQDEPGTVGRSAGPIAKKVSILFIRRKVLIFNNTSIIKHDLKPQKFIDQK